VAFAGESDPVWSGTSNAIAVQAAHGETAYGWGDHSNEGYLTNELDPVWGIVSNAITVQAQQGQTAYGWGDHGTNAYLTGYTETDPEFQTSVASLITGADYLRWNEAHGWGDHATNGYLTGYTETDPVAATSVWGNAQYPNALLLNGTRAMKGDLDMGGHSITNISTGSLIYSNGQSVAQKYVDAAGDSMSGKLSLPANGLVVGSSQLVVTNGYVGIGIANPTNALAVNGTIKAKETIITLSGWSDFVFEKDYDLMPLSEVEAFIHKNGHLPGVPSAGEVMGSGLKLGETQAMLLQKIEELTLYVIELKKTNDLLRNCLYEKHVPAGKADLW